MKQIFPKEIIESTIETHLFRHGTKSKIIYLIILLSILTILALLPFIYVDIYSTSRGIIKPEKERMQINAPITGKVKESYIVDNAQVKKGDTLLRFDTSIVAEQLNFIQRQMDETSLFIEDLDYLVGTKNIALAHIQSPKYKKEAIFFKQKRQELQTKYKKEKRDFERAQTLFDKGIIARTEYENEQLNYDLVINQIKQLKEQHYNTWQAQLTTMNANLVELNSNYKQTLQNKYLHVVTAPISGSVISSINVGANSFLAAGHTLGELSPDTALHVECLVTPYDIGLLQQNAVVNFQIDAYNYNQWGMSSGHIIDIAKDIEFIDNKAVFKVFCKLNDTHLQLDNGYKAPLKKGMTLTAKFLLTKRSLFDLLYDKVDDWINPGQYTTTSF
ncbi:MAG: Leukotoxin export protein LtxD [Formosa sp. Hel3_A1_48]|nr:MAG: Leukotoxin export protein LtxD [Formosa sp. Hel3_A1_48]